MPELPEAETVARQLREQLTGAVIWDNRPWQLSAVHAGDWLMKTLFMTVVLAWWSGSLRTSTRGQ